MQGYNQQTGRFYYITEAIPGGMNTAIPLRSLSEGEASYLLGVLPAFGHLIPGYTPATELWAGTFTENIRYIFRYYGAIETLVLLGTTRAWVYQVGAPVAKTPTPAFNVNSILWKGGTLIHNHLPVAVVNNHGLNFPHYWNGGAGAFIIIPNAPLTRTFCSWWGRMLNGNVYDTAWYVNRLWWSAINDITDYLDISSGYLDLDGESDPILALEVTVGNVVLIFRRNSIYLGIPAGLVENPLMSQFLSNYGLRAPNSVQREGHNYYYLGDSDIYVIAGYEAPVNIGAKIRKELFAQSDPALLGNAWSFMDISRKLYYLVTTLLDGSQRAWIYNYEQQAWSTQTFTGIYSLGVWHA